MKLDLPLLLITLCLALTLGAYFLGYISYPIGVVVLLILLYFKLRDLNP